MPTALSYGMHRPITASTLAKPRLPVSKYISKPPSCKKYLRLLSYNIQAGIDTHRYRQYVTNGWRHLLPDSKRQGNLDHISQILDQYDMVGLQEVDAGSLRTGFIEQTGYLADRAGFPYWAHQINRKLGQIALYSNGFLSRYQPTSIVEHRLPGLPGRGAMAVTYGRGEDQLVLCILHLALGRRTRLRQLAYICDLLQDSRYTILMGDFNCSSQSQEMDYLLSHSELRAPVHGLNTFPSWRPHRNIDHILASSNLKIKNVRVLNYPGSDHLPISMSIALPDDLQFA